MSKTYVGLSDLPRGYTQVEFLESTGTQYINTGVVPLQNKTKIVCDYEFTELPTGDNASYIFGVRDNVGGVISNRFQVYNSTNAKLQCGFGALFYSMLDPYDTNRHTVTLDAKGLKVIVDETEQTITNGTLSSHSIFLFALSDNGTPSYRGKAKIYSCQIYDNGVLAHDYVPSIRSSDLVAGLYDRQTDSFLTNSGTGTFVIGERAGVAHKIEKIYGSVGGVAKSITRAYVGDSSNKAKLIFGNPAKKYLIKDGYINFTLWRVDSPGYGASSSKIRPELIYESNYIDFYFTGNHSGNIRWPNIIATPYTKLCLDYYVSSSYVTIAMSLQEDTTTYISSSPHLLNNLKSTTRTTEEWDISEITGSFYLYLNMRTTSSSSSRRDFYVYNVWLE